MPKPAELQLTPGKPMRWMMARSIYVEEVKGALFFFFSFSLTQIITLNNLTKKKRSSLFTTTIDEKSEQMLYITGS